MKRVDSAVLACTMESSSASTGRGALRREHWTSYSLGPPPPPGKVGEPGRIWIANDDSWLSL